MTWILRFTLREAYLSFLIPGDPGLVVAESLKHCILDQWRLLTMLCCHFQNSCIPLLGVRPWPLMERVKACWEKILKTVRCIKGLCNHQHFAPLFDMLFAPCSVKRTFQINRQVICNFRCRKLARNMSLFIPCNGSLDVSWLERLSVSPQMVVVGKYLMTFFKDVSTKMCKHTNKYSKHDSFS